jgi:UDPglucose 6-dehydrogenase
MVLTDIGSAEMIKYASNAFLVTKISFINEIANFCELIDADIDDVARGIGLDSRIGSHFLRAGAGYGGSCFPKDARALDFYCMDNGYDFLLLKSCIEVNMRQRILIVQKLHRALGGIAGKKIALLGLAFKPDTDDVRESPAMAIASLLYEEGARISACDPMALDKARPNLPRDILLTPDVQAACEGAQAICLVTEWPEFINANWRSIRERVNAPYSVVDGRNALDRRYLESLGFNYCGVGRKFSLPLALYR